MPRQQGGEDIGPLGPKHETLSPKHETLSMKPYKP